MKTFGDPNFQIGAIRSWVSGGDNGALLAMHHAAIWIQKADKEGMRVDPLVVSYLKEACPGWPQYRPLPRYQYSGFHDAKAFKHCLMTAKPGPTWNFIMVKGKPYWRHLATVRISDFADPIHTEEHLEPICKIVIDDSEEWRLFLSTSPIVEGAPAPDGWRIFSEGSQLASPGLPLD
jgi:hypothetical protein